MREKVKLLEFEKNSNIGVYLVVTNYFALCGKELSQNKRKELEELYKVPIYHFSCFGTELCGIFLSCNDTTILSPKLFFEELELLKKIAEKHNVRLFVKEHLFNTYGNSVFLGKSFAYVGENYSKEFQKELKEFLDLPVFCIKSLKFGCIGTLFREINDNLLASYDLEDEEIEKIEQHIKALTSVNSGSPFIASAIVGNKYGITIGSESSSVEIQTILENSNFL